ncbi:MAG TPA: nuclear transport factor 2 family protein [Candidatus Acidoferrales bacterium]
MKTAVINVFLGLAAVILAACGTPEKTTDPGTSASVTNQGAVAVTADDLLALDNQANAAYLRSDSKFFEETLSDKFVMREGGRQMDKAAIVKLIAGNKCNVKRWKLEDPQMARIDADIYVLSYRGTFDGSCSGPDGELKIPSPIRAATVWIRAGGTWRAAFHGQDPIFDAQSPPLPAKANGQKGTRKDDKAAPSANIAADPSSAAMMAVEKSVWEAWKAKDAKKLDELTTADLSFQNIFGVYFANKADTLKNWTSAYCDIKRVSVADGAGTMLSPNVGILNRTGTAEGSCNGQNFPLVPIYGTSVYVKEGDSWKLAFSLNRLD